MIDPGLVKDAVLALLDVGGGLTVYDGEVNETPPADFDGRVEPYAVLWAGPGRQYATTICDVPRDLAWTCQVTAVGGDADRCLWAVARVRERLTGARPVVDGAQTGLLVETLDAGVARVLIDQEPRPPRHYVPMPYGLDLTG